MYIQEEIVANSSSLTYNIPIWYNTFANLSHFILQILHTTYSNVNSKGKQRKSTLTKTSAWINCMNKTYIISKGHIWDLYILIQDSAMFCKSSQPVQTEEGWKERGKHYYSNPLLVPCVQVSCI